MGYGNLAWVHFQSQVGETKVVLNNQVNNAMQCIEFVLGINIFLIEIENECTKKLKRPV